MNSKFILAFVATAFVLGLYIARGFPDIATHILNVAAYLYLLAALLLLFGFYTASRMQRSSVRKVSRMRQTRN